MLIYFIDEWFNERLERGIKKLSADMSDEKKFKTITNQFVGKISPAFQTPIFLWMEKPVNKKRIQSHKQKKKGMYEYASLKDVKWTKILGIIQTIKVNNTLIGKDKLGHFICQGLQYYKEFKQAMSEGLNEEQAYRRVILFGHNLEMKGQGLRNDGAYSVADLAANWQGLKFWRNIFEGTNSYIDKTDKGFIQKRKFTLKDYITSDMDEALNPPLFDKIDAYRSVEARIMKYCNNVEESLFNLEERNRNWIMETYTNKDIIQDFYKPIIPCL